MTHICLMHQIVREVDEKMKESATYAPDALSEENKQKTNYFIGSYKTQLESDTGMLSNPTTKQQ